MANEFLKLFFVVAWNEVSTKDKYWWTKWMLQQIIKVGMMTTSAMRCTRNFCLHWNENQIAKKKS